MPSARGACTTWYESREEEKDEEDDKGDGDSNYDDEEDDDDDARFNHWKIHGYMRTPKVFYSWQEPVRPLPHPHPVMQTCIDPIHP